MIRRNIGNAVRAALDDTPVILVVGARQTGKTTLARSLVGDGTLATYLTFDDATTLGAARSDPQGFIGGLAGRVVLDEVQKAPEVFPAIKAAVDRERTAGRFFLTGSANVLTLPRLSESLAGRMEVLTLWPLSQGEIKGRQEGFVDAVLEGRGPRSGQKEDSGLVLAELLKGGFPEVVRRSQPARRRAWFQSYLTTILQRDIRDLSNVEGLVALPNLLSLLATRSASLLNVADLARMAGVPLTSIKRYLALLETVFLVTRLPAWSRNRDKRLGKTPKVYVPDVGLLTHLLRLEPDAFDRDRTPLGPVLETFVVAELLKQASWSESSPRLYQFRTHMQAEVDIVLEDGRGRVAGIEVKASSTVRPADFAGMRVLADAAGEAFVQGVVLYLGTDVVPFGKGLSAWPLSQLWKLGAHDETRSTTVRHR